MKQGYYIEHNGDCWQSVFPSHEAHLSQLHATTSDARAYFRECGVKAPRLIRRINAKTKQPKVLTRSASIR